MKKLIAALLALVMLFALCACGPQAAPAQDLILIPDSAEQLYTDAINHNLDASPDYIRGIIDFYEALVDEGYIEEFGE